MNVLGIYKRGPDKNDATFSLIATIIAFEYFAYKPPSRDNVEKLLFKINGILHMVRNSRTYCSRMGIKYAERTMELSHYLSLRDVQERT
jgi:hypothetical protein